MTEPTVSLRAALEQARDDINSLPFINREGRLVRARRDAIARIDAALAQPAPPTDEAWARADYNGHVPNRYVPDLPTGCALFAVNPDTEAWHYVNHAGTWQGMPNPLAPTEVTPPHDGLQSARWRAFIHQSDVPTDGTWFVARSTKPGWAAVRVVCYTSKEDRLPTDGTGWMWPSEPMEWMPLTEFAAAVSPIATPPAGLGYAEGWIAGLGEAAKRADQQQVSCQYEADSRLPGDPHVYQWERAAEEFGMFASQLRTLASGERA